MKLLIIILCLILLSFIAFSSTLSDGEKDVTTAGDAEVLIATSTVVNSVLIYAKSTNTGYIYVGDAGVTSLLGIPLDAGESISFGTSSDDKSNLTDIYLDSSVDGEGVLFTYLVAP